MSLAIKNMKETNTLTSLDKFNYYLIASIFILAFTKGIPVLLGFPETIIQLFIELLIFILFINSLFFILKRKKIRGPGLLVNFYLLTVIFISFLFTDVNTIKLILFLRKFAVYYLFFYALFNININLEHKQKLLKLIIFLFLIQIPAAFIKLIVLGGTLEKIVGTMSVMEGSLATIMPLVAISYLIANYLELKRNKYIIYILLFIAIGLISNKMGILFYIIFLYIVMAYFDSKSKYFLPNAALMQKLSIGSIFLTIIFVLFVILNPRANPEHKVGGSIDLQYLEDFTIKYQTLDQKTGVEGDGRFDAPFVAYDRLSDRGILKILFGFGPGEIIKSSFTPYKKPLLEKYNIGYGGRLALVWTIMQIGFIGMIFFLLFHIILFKKAWKVYKIEKMDKDFRIIVLTVLGFSVIYFLDYFTYSTEMIQNVGIACTYYYAFYYILTTKDFYLEE
jgi:hypothetical protein